MDRKVHSAHPPPPAARWAQGQRLPGPIAWQHRCRRLLRSPAAARSSRRARVGCGTAYVHSVSGRPLASSKDPTTIITRSMRAQIEVTKSPTTVAERTTITMPVPVLPT